ncbi:hypothetical protein EDD17DRAFT_1607174 [Pisolithus thermaeus]|nr:hypothetical protein EDD17DRAFT_1607174 [Pisolithus thermaeus]
MVLAEKWACIQWLPLIYLIMAKFYGSETSLQQCSELLHYIFSLIDITHRKPVKRSPRPKVSHNAIADTGLWDDERTILNGESKGRRFILHE